MAPPKLKLLGWNVFGTADFGCIRTAESVKMSGQFEGLEVDVGVFQVKEGNVSGHGIIDDVLGAEIIVAKN